MPTSRVDPGQALRTVLSLSLCLAEALLSGCGGRTHAATTSGGAAVSAPRETGSLPCVEPAEPPPAPRSAQPAVLHATPDGPSVEWEGRECSLSQFGAGPGSEVLLHEDMALLPSIVSVQAIELGTCTRAWELRHVWVLRVREGVVWIWHGPYANEGAAGHLRWIDLHTGLEVLHRTIAFPSAPAPAPDGGPRYLLLVAERDDRLVLAARCSPNDGQECPTWVGAFDLAGSVLWSTVTSNRLSLVSESAHGVAIASAGVVEVRAWASGEVREHFELGATPDAAALHDDGTYVWSESWNRSALHARDPDGSERWVVEDARLMGFSASGVVARTAADVRLLDLHTGVSRCRRMIRHFEGCAEDIEACAHLVCEDNGPDSGSVRGVVFVDGAARQSVRIQVGDQVLVTDRRGRFSAEFGAVGRVDVWLESRWVGSRCANLTNSRFGDVFVDLFAHRREAFVVLDVVTSLPTCHGGCDDCR